MYYDIWRMDALNELQSYAARKQALEIIPGRITELRETATAIRSSTSDATPVKGGGSGREDALLNNIVCRQKLEKSLERTKESVSRVERALGTLTQDDRRILECFYILPRKGAVSQLASELHLDEKTIYNRRNNAVYLFRVAMCGEIL